MTLRLLAEAEEEAREAAHWYEQRRAGLGDAFLDALAQTLARIERTPRLHGVIPEAPAGRDVRRALLGRFPYAVIYEIRDTEILVLAVAHTRRRPGYWLSRNGGAG
jgi:plasmid stabilization system protein ParE